MSNLRIWLVEPVEGSNPDDWKGYDRFRRIIVQGADKKTAKAAIKAARGTKAYNKSRDRAADRGYAMMPPWENPDATTWTEWPDGADAKVLFVE